MIRKLMAGLLFALVMVCAHAQPSEADLAAYRAKLREYVAAGTAPDAIARGMKGWFGWIFIAEVDYPNGTTSYLVVLRDASNGDSIYFMRTIGTVANTRPLDLIATDEELTTRQVATTP